MLPRRHYGFSFLALLVSISECMQSSKYAFNLWRLRKYLFGEENNLSLAEPLSNTFSCGAIKSMRKRGLVNERVGEWVSE